ncbi:MAG TPA: hypothetical protein VIK18_10460 [Pirellulales bacterium]
MRATLIALFASLVYLPTAYVRAEPAKPAAAATEPQAAQRTATAAAPSATAAKSAADELASRPEPWRYQWHNNHWWYYTPQDSWLYYDSHGWQTYVPPTAMYSSPRYHRSYTTQKHVDPGHSLDTTGNYPRYWLWQRLGN